jgi:hypothetical protein
MDAVLPRHGKAQGRCVLSYRSCATQRPRKKCGPFTKTLRLQKLYSHFTAFLQHFYDFSSAVFHTSESLEVTRG